MRSASLFLVALLLAARSAPAAESGGIVLATGSPVGVYFAVGNALCRLLGRDAERGGNKPPPGCAVKITGGSAANVELLRSGAADLAIVQSDVLHHAVHGTGRFEGRRLDKLRAVFSLHTEPFQLLVLPGFGIGGPADLKGRKVNFGPHGSAQSEMLGELARLHGHTERSFSQVLRHPPGEQFNALCEGDVEALGMFIGYPNPGYTGAMRKCGARLVDVDSEAVRRFVAERPYFSPATIPAAAYPGLDRDVRTFGVLAVLVTTTDADPAAVARVARAAMTGIDAFRGMHAALAALDVRRMTHQGIAAPLHPEAARIIGRASSP